MVGVQGFRVSGLGVEIFAAIPSLVMAFFCKVEA